MPEVGKPGTNWKQVTPANRRKLSALIEHYRKKPHPFTSCVRDNTKRFGPERAKRICAVVKDLGRRTTKWRKGGGKRLREASDEAFAAAAFDEVIAPALEEAGVTPDELAGWVDDAQAAGLLVEARADPMDFTAEQLAAAEPHARERLAVLAGAGLPATGPGAELDGRLVEAATRRGPGAIGQALRIQRERERARERRGREGGRDPDFERKHPRTRGGKFTVKRGDSGEEVRTVQRAIGAKEDGNFGDRTRRAVMAFQRRNGLAVDGVVGRQTAAAIRGRKDAKKVKAGKLSESDREFLRGKRKRQRAVEASDGRLVEAGATEEFDPRLHPRDRRGRFRRVLSQLKQGATVRLPDGTSVTAGKRYSKYANARGAGREYVVRGADGSRTVALDGDEAATAALGASARAAHPASIGGETRYPTLSRAEDAEHERDRAEIERQEAEEFRRQRARDLERVSAIQPGTRVLYRDDEGLAQVGTVVSVPPNPLDATTPAVVRWDHNPAILGVAPTYRLTPT